jgi:hypothetical protein
MFVAAGILKEAVDDLPLLCNIHLDDSIATLTVLSNSTEIVQDTQKGNGRQHNPSIDSLMGRKLIWGSWSVMRTLKRGQHTTRVMINEKRCTMGPELVLLVALIVRHSLGGAT